MGAAEVVTFLILDLLNISCRQGTIHTWKARNQLDEICLLLDYY